MAVCISISWARALPINSCITQVDALEKAIDRRGKQSALDPHIRRSAVSLDVDAFLSSLRLDLDLNFRVMVFVL